MDDREPLIIDDDEYYDNLQKQVLSNSIGHFYIVTNDKYIKDNTYIIGFTDDNLVKRLKMYNEIRADNERVYYVYHYRVANIDAIGYFIMDLLKDYRESLDRREIVILELAKLKLIIEKICTEYDVILSNISKDIKPEI